MTFIIYKHSNRIYVAGFCLWQRSDLPGEDYSKTSIREITRGVSVGVGSIYNYFENTDELFCVVLRPMPEALERMLQEYHEAKGADIMLLCSEDYVRNAVEEYI